MSTPAKLSATATKEEMATVQCTNPQEAVKYQKGLQKAAEVAIKCFQKGDDAPGECPLQDIMPDLIEQFKVQMKMVFEPAKKANQGEVLKSITDSGARCIWEHLEEPDDSTDNDDEATIQEEVSSAKCVHWMQFIHSIDADLTEDQTKCIVQLFKSNSIMLEHQVQVAHQLVELGETLDSKTFLLVMKSSVRPMYQISIPNKFMPTFPLRPQ